MSELLREALALLNEKERPFLCCPSTLCKDEQQPLLSMRGSTHFCCLASSYSWLLLSDGCMVWRDGSMSSRDPAPARLKVAVL